MQTRQTGRADVHSGPFADRIEPLQNLNIFRAVIGAGLLVLRRHSYLVRSEKQAVTCDDEGDSRTGILPGSHRRDAHTAYLRGVR